VHLSAHLVPAVYSLHLCICLHIRYQQSTVCTCASVCTSGTSSLHLVPAVYSLHKKQTSVHFILVQFKPHSHETDKQYKIQFHQYLHHLLQTFFDKEYAYCYYLKLWQILGSWRGWMQVTIKWDVVLCFSLWFVLQCSHHLILHAADGGIGELGRTGSTCGLNEALSWYMPGKPEKIQKNLTQTVSTQQRLQEYIFWMKMRVVTFSEQSWWTFESSEMLHHVN